MRTTVQLACIGLVAMFQPAAMPAQPPNIVLILVDDLGWADLSCYGNRYIDTPHIDRLASRGVRFTDAYSAAPVCAPTRVSLLTGQHPARIGMPMLTRPHRRPWARLTPPQNAYALPTSTPTLAPELTRAGYVSTLIGKWHLGFGNRPHDLDSFTMPPGMGPKSPGVAFGFTRPPLLQEDGQANTPEDEFARQNPYKGIGPQVAQAVNFIKAHQGGPFFVFLSYSMVHIPMQARPELITKYNERIGGTGAGIDPRYAAMIETVDESVGLITDTLRALNLYDRTAVFFASDNGGLIRVYHGEGPVVTSNEPLRGEKGTLYEGGVRIPFIASLPGMFREGAVEEQPALTTDLLPTFLDLAGVKPPDNHIFDGVSLKPNLANGALIEDRALYWHYPAYHHSTPASSIRLGRYKLLEFYEGDRRELYDLEADLGEETDLAEKEPRRVEELAKRLDAWRLAVGARLPTPNPHYDSARAHVWGVRPELPWQDAPRAALRIRHVE
ncbi:MAG: sulfatase [Bryobacterales bacterium]|nr:sulfatase [Bryobacterales bacterium]